MSTSAEPRREPDEPLYGAQTRRALTNFPGHGRRLADVGPFLQAYGWVKAAAAQANVELGVLDAARGEAIVAAAAEVAAGEHDDHFPTPLVQGGGGTSTNMNLNEVLATRANQLLAAGGADVVVHANDHVNRSQSTNDTYPTAMALALRALARPAVAALDGLESALRTKADEYDETVRLARTCLQDALPVTVGRTHRAQAGAVRRCRHGLHDATEALSAVPLGATAVGTGIGAPEGYAALAVARLQVLAGTEVTVSEDFADALAYLDPYAAVAAAAVRATLVLNKIATDLRLLSSGPLGGLGEVTLPPLQAGSSIMPGKVNPVVPELVMQLGHRIRGAATTVELAVAAGELELNVMEPVILDALVTVLTDLAAAADTFTRICITGLTWNHEALTTNLRGSLQEYVELAARDGYDTARAARDQQREERNPTTAH